MKKAELEKLKAELEATCAILKDDIREARQTARDFAESHTEQVAENERLRAEHNSFVDQASIDIVALPFAIRRIDELEADNKRLDEQRAAELNNKLAVEAENERLLGLLADPKLISIEVNERCSEVIVQPREDIMRHLFVMMAHALGDSKNYVECDFGPDSKTGKRYTLTLKHYFGKSPARLHEEEIAEHNEVIRQLIDIVQRFDEFEYAMGTAETPHCLSAPETETIDHAKSLLAPANED